MLDCFERTVSGPSMGESRKYIEECRDNAVINRESCLRLPYGPFGFVGSSFGGADIENIEEVWVVTMHLVWIDADKGASSTGVSFIHLSDFPCK